MIMNKNIVIILMISFLSVYLVSCEKFLSERPNNSLTHPNGLKDLQAMLDAGINLNFGNYSFLLDAATDDIMIGEGGINRLSDFHRAIYFWDPHPYFQVVDVSQNWANPFHTIAVANIVLEELPLIEYSNGLSYAEIEGAALFHRAFTYLNLVQVFCATYDSSNADNELGLPLRRTSDINQRSVRSNLRETFDFIESDLITALELLPIQSHPKTRPNKIAAHALLARMYLLKDQFEEALLHAQEALRGPEKLMDFNALDPLQPYPIPEMNEETIFFAYSSVATLLTSTRECYIDTTLYSSYLKEDLRRDLFFKSENNGFHTFRGSYLGSGMNNCFVGLTVSEMELIVAESLARFDNSHDAIKALNRLLMTRFQQGAFEPYEATKSEEVLQLILQERRKELIFRGVRWSDLKRLNKDPRFAKSLMRKIPGKDLEITLPPGDPRYVYLIPQSIIELTKMTQNKR